MQNDNQSSPFQSGAASPQADTTPPQPAAAPQTVFNPTISPTPAQPDAAAQASTATQPAAMPDSAAPQPAFGAPQSDTTAQPFGVASSPADPAAPQAFMPGTVSSAPSKKHKLPLMLALGVGGALVLGAGAFIALRMFFGGISAADMDAAHDASNSLAGSLSSLSVAASGIDSAETLDELTEDARTANTKMSDVQKQIDLLRASNVQRDKTVHEKFTALETKWNAYKAYIQNSIKDEQALLPMVDSLEEDITNLTKGGSPTSKAELATYLTNYKAIIDKTVTGAGKLQLSIDTNKQMLVAFQDFLKTSSDAVAAAQSDLNAGKDLYTVTNHLYDVSSAESKLSTKLLDLQGKARDKMDEVSPSDQFDALRTALMDLESKISK